MSPLSEDDRRALLRLARQAIVEAVVHNRMPPSAAFTGVLALPGGVFVTLHQRGQLRGCIGVIEPSEPLAEAVVRCALSAALQDPRFSGVTPEEIPGLEIEVSVLSPLFRIRPEKLEVGRHGLVVSKGPQRGVLLPQVATEHGWGRETFLAETCRKAGLAPDAWRDPGTDLRAFTTEIVSENIQLAKASRRV